MIQSFKQIFILRKTLLWGMVALCVLTFGAYAYFVQGTISNIVFRQDALEEAAALTSSIGDIESRYDVLRNSITRESAKVLGFGEPYKKIFVSKKSLVQEHIVSF